MNFSGAADLGINQSILQWYRSQGKNFEETLLIIKEREFIKENQFEYNGVKKV